MDQRTAPELVHIFPHHFRTWLVAHFNGFHHMIANAAGLMKTTLAVVPQWNKEIPNTTAKQISDVLTKCNAINLMPTKKKNAYRDYIKILHNRGQSLQTRAESAVMTRDVLVLVKGGHVAHAATRCKIDGWATTTAAHATIEASALAEIVRQLNIAKINMQQYGNNSNSNAKTLHALYLVGTLEPKDFVNVLSLSSKLEGVTGKPQLPAALMANVIVAAATMQTGFSDAGARFRDRTSRQEAARHFAEGVNSLLHATLLS